MYTYIYIYINLWCSVIIIIIILVLIYILVLLLLQPQASIVTYIVTEFLLPLLFYLLYITAAAATITTYSILLLLLYLLLFTIPFVLLATIYHCQKKRKTLLYIFERHELFLAVFYSLQSSHVLFCNALPTAAAYSTHSATGNFLMGAETTDIHVQKRQLLNGGKPGIYMHILMERHGKIAAVAAALWCKARFSFLGIA